MNLKVRRLRLFSLMFVMTASVLLIGSAGEARAATLFYKDKTISLISTGGPGGGTDLLARQISSILPKYLPGKPRIVVRSKPGGSGTVALNTVYNKAKPDGLTLGLCGASPVGLYLRKAKIVKYDLLKMPYLGVVNPGGTLVVVRKEALKRLTDPKADPVVVGTKEAASSWAPMIFMAQEFAGWNVRWILGFRGASDLELAIRRGEIDMFGASRQVGPLMKEGVAVGVVQHGTYSKGKFSRRPDYPNFPTLVELLGDKKPTGLAWEGYMAATAGSTLFKNFLAPPGTPDHFVKILRDAFGKMVKDPKYIKIWHKLVSPVFNAYAGEDLDPIVKEILNVSPEAAAYMTTLKNKYVK